MTRALLAIGFLLWGLSAVYAWKDWYKSLCGLIVFTAVFQHPDMPKAILGVPGLNPWNLLFLIVLCAWMAQRGSERLRWDMPRVPAFLLLLGLGIEIIGFSRLIMDRESLYEDLTTSGLISEYLVNTVKWVIVGLLLFDGCRVRRRLALALASVFSFYVLISLQVLRSVLPALGLDAGALSKFAMVEIATTIGYHKNDMSVMLAGAFWALIALRATVISRCYRAIIGLGSVTVLLAQGITGGRAGYLAWCAIGLTLGFVRWRRYLLLVPLLVALAGVFLPSVVDRALHGLSGDGEIRFESIDLEDVTAGRTLIWPLVIDQIWNAPFIGHGRAAMQRTGVSSQVQEIQLIDAFIGHPHNAYLEMLLDSGLIGLMIALALYGTFLAFAIALLREHRNTEQIALGGIGLSVVLALLVGAVTGQSFWPREPTFAMWCVIGLLLRVWTDRTRVLEGTPSQRPYQRTLGIAADVTSPAGLPAPPNTEWWRRRESRHASMPSTVPRRSA